MKKMIIVICALFYGTFSGNSQCDLKLKENVLDKSKSDGFIFLKEFNFELSEPKAVAKYSLLLNAKSYFRFYVGISDKYLSEVDFSIYKGKNEIKKMHISQGMEYLDFCPDTSGVYQIFSLNAKGAKSCGIIVFSALDKNIQNPSNNQIASDNEIYVMVDEMPQFIKGDDMSFPNWIMQNLKYPEEVKNKSIQGKAIMQFIVDKEGKMQNIKVIRGLDPEIDIYLVEFLKTSPTWQKPGKIKGKAVNVVFTLPIKLLLDNNKK